MQAHIDELFSRFRRSTWADIDGLTELLDIYDSLLAGAAGLYLDGQMTITSPIPGPDPKWCNAYLRFRHQSAISSEEKSFIEYFELAESLRIALKRTRDAIGNVSSRFSLTDRETDLLLDAFSDYHGVWRAAWDMKALLLKDDTLAARAEAKEALRSLLSEGWISLFHSVLLNSSSRTRPEHISPEKVAAVLEKDKIWLPPHENEVEFLTRITPDGQSRLLSL